MVDPAMPKGLLADASSIYFLKFQLQFCSSPKKIRFGELHIAAHKAIGAIEEQS